MPGSTRQATPGPSTLSSAIPTNPSYVNPKKRPGSDATDETREAKKPKVDGEALPLSANNNNNKEKDKKKKKKKKKRRMSVVAGAPQPSLRDRETPKPRSSAVPPASVVTKPKSPDHANVLSEGKQASSSSDKGKDKVHSPSHSQRACTPPVEPMQPVASGSGSSTDETRASEIAHLKAQLASQKILLERHQNHLTQHQQAITCQICLDLMHKPYALAPCGHTTCYGCLVRWFTAPNNPEAANAATAENDGIDAILNSPIAVNGAYIRRRKNCPVCRAAVTDRPIEMWGIKGMVVALVKSGLGDLPLPPPAAVEASANVDPWRNVFRKASAPSGPLGGLNRFFAPAAPPVDDEDRQEMGWYDGEDGGIYRCVDCYHEIIYAQCSFCQRPYAGHAGGDDDDDEDGGSDFDVDDPHFRAGLRGRLAGGPVADADDMDDDSIDDEDEDMYMYQPGGEVWGADVDDDVEDDGLHMDPVYYDGRHMFETDDEEDEPNNLEHPHRLQAPLPYAHFAELLLRHQNPQPPRGQRGPRIEEVGLGEEEEEEQSDYEGSFIDDGAEHDAHGAIDVDGEDASDDEVEVVDGPYPVPRAPPARRRHPVQSILSSDDEPEEIEDPRILARTYGRNRHRMVMNLLDEDEDEDDQRSDDPSVEGGELLTSRGRVEYPLMLSDEEDDLAAEGSEDEF
ncbi:hypothetical protein HYPSUDRAFT_37729 [Hypholoma sublateritium FD-334 SS-4]|uniref:RING-type domain-containing protein n=1 Tax=Hypholoma sublateritium (strain FD-334 SS-4) TaxID=945553 RepID=A0A0D2P9J8_HYPSF|nr:hypothetical protein HYPSUDRAFT_37729 [Hypholoma sublateritium FD-334 SS-4]